MFRWRWVPSERNPADPPSRRFQFAQISQGLGPPSEHLLACRPSTCPGESKLRYLASTCQKLSLSTREPSKHEQLFENCMIEVATGQTEIFSKLCGVLGGPTPVEKDKNPSVLPSRPVVSTETGRPKARRTLLNRHLHRRLAPEDVRLGLFVNPRFRRSAALRKLLSTSRR